MSGPPLHHTPGLPTAGFVPAPPASPQLRVGGILLTGGSSSRMGRDKASMLVGGEPNARRIGKLLSRLAHPLVEVGPGISGLAAVREEPLGGGPLVAIGCGGRALRALGHLGPALVLACDLPFVDEALLAFLVGRKGPESVIPSVAGSPQPLCARWSPVDLAVAGALAAAGERAIKALPWDPRTDRPEERDWSVAVDAASFADVDTPADLTRLGLSYDAAFEWGTPG
ncbi:MAG: molybdopterin-guanine dinucleotide biosynthesis protein [Acidimicrobiaceae bacterium]|nr:molybdopterin-guanine dinucleotide biosynthesis protein [Acidimicrobiaceae bacterium]